MSGAATKAAFSSSSREIAAVRMSISACRVISGLHREEML